MERSREKDKKRARAASPDSEVEYVEEKPKAPDIIKISDSESDHSGSEEDERGPLLESHLLLYTTKYVSSYYYTVLILLHTLYLYTRHTLHTLYMSIYVYTSYYYTVLILLNTLYLYTRQANPQSPSGMTSEPVRGERQK